MQFGKRLALACAMIVVLGQGAAEPAVVLIDTVADDGPGSLRHALEQAQQAAGPTLIRFDAQQGPFALPQVIRLARELPEIRTRVEIDGYIEDHLWEAIGITLSGRRANRVLRVAPGGALTLRSLTLTEGRASDGGALLNRGTLVLSGVTLVDNVADEAGGAVASEGPRLVIVNSTLARNSAGKGGAVSSIAGAATITHATFAGNAAALGGGVFNSGQLLLRNSVLADSRNAADCTNQGRLLPGSAPNLIETNENCGETVSSADPRLGELSYYNGPTQTMPLNAGSPAINFGDNKAALDENGRTLTWDQRGNGDPRFVAGVADLGAFEVQVPTVLRVDTRDDRDLRECTAALADCSLWGAIHLANAMPGRDAIGFDERIFAGPTVLDVTTPLPQVTGELRLDAPAGAAIELRHDGGAALQVAPGVAVELRGVVAKTVLRQ